MFIAVWAALVLSMRNYSQLFPSMFLFPFPDKDPRQCFGAVLERI